MIWIDPKICPHNHPCIAMRKCPQHAIEQDGVKVPTIDRRKCVNCKLCFEGCPQGAIKDVSFSEMR